MMKIAKKNINDDSDNSDNDNHDDNNDCELCRSIIETDLWISIYQLLRSKLIYRST